MYFFPFPPTADYFLYYFISTRETAYRAACAAQLTVSRKQCRTRGAVLGPEKPHHGSRAASSLIQHHGQQLHSTFLSFIADRECTVFHHNVILLSLCTLVQLVLYGEYNFCLSAFLSVRHL